MTQTQNPQTPPQNNADMLVDRRKLKRRLNKWRGIALALLITGFFGYVALNEKIAASLGISDQIARIEISGVILEDHARAVLLKQIAKSPSVKAVLVRINSPGGTTTGGEALYEQLRLIAKDRPVVAVFGTMATSAAYMSGVAADHIVARGNTITGSVGVIMQWAEVSAMMNKLGIAMNEMKSGNLKAVPSPFSPLDEEGRALTQDMIDESHKWFVDLVAKRRGINPDQIPGFLKGRVFSGRQALTYGLIDTVGGERQALDWLEAVKKIDKTLPVIDWQQDSEDQGGLLGWARAQIAMILGGNLTPLVEQFTTSGLISLGSGQLISK